jgi:DNA-directed RNA polymerase beta' subunit
VTHPETINYRTHSPDKGGLFCEKIFGPTRDWECACGKFKRIRYKGIICDKCGVEIARAKVRYERMGHIELAIAIEHPLVEGLLLNSIPVLPPELRPMIRVGNRYATSDLNDLYCRVINRNNRVLRLREYGAPPVVIANEIRILIETVDNLFFGGVNDSEGRSLVCLLDNIKELLTVNIKSEPLDYSASCGVCPDEKIADESCALPYGAALELFKPFIMRELVNNNITQY